MKPQQAQSPSANQTTGIPFWYMHGLTKFGAKKGLIFLTPGMLRVTDEANGQEIYSYKISPDIQLKRIGGFARITFVNGQAIKMRDRKYMFYFYNPKMLLLAYAFMTRGASTTESFISACKQAAGAAQ